MKEINIEVLDRGFKVTVSKAIGVGDVTIAFADKKSLMKYLDGEIY